MAIPNKLADLNNHLFEQLERLNDESLSTDELRKEVIRTKSMAHIASAIIGSGTLMLQAKKYSNEFGDKNMPDVLRIDEVKKITTE